MPEGVAFTEKDVAANERVLDELVKMEFSATPAIMIDDEATASSSFEKGDAAVANWRLAPQEGIHPRTIRYCEALGLLSPPARSSSAHRIYGEADRERLDFVAAHGILTSAITLAAGDYPPFD